MHWGWKNENFSAKTRKRIARAAYREGAYDLGYESELSCAMLPKWHIKVIKGIGIVEKDHPLSPENLGLTKYCD